MNIRNMKQDDLFTNENLDAIEKKMQYERNLNKMASREEYRIRNKLDMSKDSRWNSTTSSY